MPPKPPAFDPLDPPRTADAAEGATKPDAADGDVPKPLTDEPAAEPELPEPEEPEGDEEEPYDGFFPKLNEQGIALELVYTGETMGLYRGGFNTRNAQKYRGNLDMVMTADLEKLGIGPGIFFIYGQNGHGRGMTERFLGDFQVLSNIDANDFTQLSEYWWESQIIDERFRVRIGQQDANVDFAVVDLGGDFINSSFGFSPTIPLPSFPYNSMAAVGFWDIRENLTLKAGIWDGVLPSGTWTRVDTNAPFFMLELKHKYKIGNEMPGDWHFGVWNHQANWENLAFNGGVGQLPELRGSNGFYGGFDQMIFREEPDVESDQGLGVFGQYGWAPEDRSAAAFYIGTGLVYKGLFHKRDDDTLGVGLAHVGFSKYVADVDSESYVEFFYKAKLTKTLTLQPDLQFIRHPGGAGRDAVAAGLRFELALH